MEIGQPADTFACVSPIYLLCLFQCLHKFVGMDQITVEPRFTGSIWTKIFPLYLRFTFKERWNYIINRDLEMLTFIDGEPLKAGLLLRGPTVLFNGKFAFCHFPMLFNGNLKIE